MGCGQKAAQEDWEEMEDALVAVGLKNDKKYGHHSDFVTQRTIRESARKGLTRDETIFAIHHANAVLAAKLSAQNEIDERNSLAELRNKY